MSMLLVNFLMHLWAHSDIQVQIVVLKLICLSLMSRFAAGVSLFCLIHCQIHKTIIASLKCLLIWQLKAAVLMMENCSSAQVCLYKILACGTMSNCCWLMYDIFFSSTARNGQGHSWPLPVRVCLSEQAGSEVLDSFEVECDCSENGCF